VQSLANNPLVVDPNCGFQGRWLHKHFDSKLIFFAEQSHQRGLFLARVKVEKVALLRQEGIEEFSNLGGLQVIPFPGERIEAAFYELARMLQREGLTK
jgi:hypothetical protein